MNYQTQCACRDCTHTVNTKENGGWELCQSCRRAECDETGREACKRADHVKPNTGGSGYTSCACRDCFDIAVSDDMHAPDLCWACEEAGCDGDGASECERPPEEEEGDDAHG